jgi:hypothetical protein
VPFYTIRSAAILAAGPPGESEEILTTPAVETDEEEEIAVPAEQAVEKAMPELALAESRPRRSS